MSEEGARACAVAYLMPCSGGGGDCPPNFACKYKGYGARGRERFVRTCKPEKVRWRDGAASADGLGNLGIGRSGGCRGDADCGYDRRGNGWKVCQDRACKRRKEEGGGKGEQN